MYLHRQLYKSPSEMQTAHYSVKWTLGMAPTISPPIQTRPYSGHFANKFVDSLVKRTARRANGFKINNTRTARYMYHLSICFTFEVTGHIVSLEIAVKPHPRCVNNPWKEDASTIQPPVLGPNDAQIRGAPLYYAG